jgi:hypothetical protein
MIYKIGLGIFCQTRAHVCPELFREVARAIEFEDLA